LVSSEIRLRAGQIKKRDTKSSPTDLVTAIDRWSEKKITDFITTKRTRDGILGEEGTTIEGTSGVKWIIDPIDGTTNFFYGLPGYTVSIGVSVDEKIVAGVIMNPFSQEEYAAALNEGATCNGSPIAVNYPIDLSETLLSTGFSYLPEKRKNQGKVLPNVRDIRRSGSAANDLTCVASGKVDAYFEYGLNIWDIAAGLIIVQEAGGKVSDLEGNFPSGDFVIAASPTIHDRLLDLLQTLSADGV
jgi:myo-inositol-1(or 4)-monophosphatase